MTVPSSDVGPWSYTGNGVTTSFPYLNKIFAASDLQVFLDGVAQATGFTVTGAGEAAGGEAVFDVAPAQGVAVLLRSEVADTQELDLVENDDQPAELMEQALDRRALVSHQQRETLTRSIRAPKGESRDMVLPAAAAIAGKLLGFDGGSLPVGIAQSDQSATSVTPIDRTTSRTLAVQGSLMQGMPDVTDPDYGADKTGVANAVAAFQAAIDATPDGGIQIIAVPGGTYLGDLSTLSLGSRQVVWVHLGDVTYSTAKPPGNRVFDQISPGGDVTFAGNYLFDATGPDTVPKNAITITKIDDGAVGAGVRINQTYDENATALGLPWAGMEVVKTKSAFSVVPSTVGHYAQNIGFERTDKAQLSALFAMVSEVGDTRPNGSFGTNPIDGFGSHAAHEIDVVSNSPQTDFGSSTIRQGLPMVGFGGGVHTAGFVLSASQNKNARSHTGSAQAGAASTITLAALAMPVDDYYNTRKIKVYEGAGAGQIRTISDYVGATKVATVDSAWTTAPDATSKYVVYDVYLSGAWKHGISIRNGSISARDGIGIFIDTIPQGTADFGASSGIFVTGKNINGDIETFSRGQTGAVKFGSDVNTNGSAVVNIRMVGWNSNNVKQNYGSIRGVIVTNTAAAEIGRIDFLDLQGGTEILEGQISGGMKLGVPTGGFKGVGTLNAVGVYDDNTLLTCAPVEHAMSGKFDLKRWDDIAPSGKHHAARFYDGMLKAGYRPESADDFAAWLSLHEAVPGLITPVEWLAMEASDDKPSIGQWGQRTALALDLSALAIIDLNRRLKLLESKP